MTVEKLSDLQIHNIPEEFLSKVRDRHRQGNPEEPDNLTELQKKVFSSSTYWDTNKNVIVQGNTSSGKTLVAEVAAVHCISSPQENNGVIYLAPLRAMVSEKRFEFIEDMKDSLSLRVYASSSDFQDQDDDILNGEFDIAVIVYEKFFALLAQPNSCKMLNKCGLIIVDELQMLSDIGRGTKLEVALTRLLSEDETKQDKQYRIIGLTTIYCDMGYVKAWLNAEIMSDKSRPKPLEEYVISIDGKYRMRKESQDGTEITTDEGSIDFVGKVGSEEDFVVPLVRHFMSNENKNIKIIIFINNKIKTLRIAQKICSEAGLRRNPAIKQELLGELNLQDDEDASKILREDLLPYGVAYHNSSLSVEIRDIIERDFRSASGNIRIIVATETLAIGLNLPADIVILTSISLPRAEDQFNEMNSNEYKNFVGRAGRFGVRGESSGKSFLIALNSGKVNVYWQKYVNAVTVSITSAYKKLSPKAQAPYLLNWMQGDISQEKLKNYLKRSFSSYCITKDRESSDSPENFHYRLDSILKELERYKLIQSKEWIDGLIYEWTHHGEALAGYALDLDTTHTFTNLLKYWNPDYNTEEFESLYILDLFYQLCLASEISNAINEPNLQPEDRKPIVDYLRKAEEQGLLLKNSVLKDIKDDESLPNDAYMKAIKRAILLQAWIKGKTLSEIRKETGLRGINIGSLNRLGEICSFLLEAFAQRVRKNMAVELVGPLYKLSGCVKYGVPKQLVKLANRHVSGITRKVLMNLDKEAAREGFSDPIQFIFSDYKITAIREKQRTVLMESLISRYTKKYDSEKGLENALLKLKADEDLSEEDYDNILKALEPNNMADWFDCIYKIFTIKKLSFVVSKDDKQGYITVNRSELPSTQVNIALLWKDKKNDQDFSGVTVEHVASFYPLREHTIFITPHNYSDEAISEIETKGCCCINIKTLITLIIESVKKCQSGKMLYNILSDGYTGYITEDEMRNLLRNYSPQIDSKIQPYRIQPNTNEDHTLKTKKLYIAYDHNYFSEMVQKLTQELNNKNISFCIDYEIVKWGDNRIDYLNQMLEEGTYVILCIEKYFLSSNSMKYIIDSLSNRLCENIKGKILPLYSDREIYKKFTNQNKIYSIQECRVWGECSVSQLADDVACLINS